MLVVVVEAESVECEAQMGGRKQEGARKRLQVEKKNSRLVRTSLL
jgi:hypothetical protein